MKKWNWKQILEIKWEKVPQNDKIAYRKITGRGFMTVCHNKQRLYVNMISKSS